MGGGERPYCPKSGIKRRLMEAMGLVTGDRGSEDIYMYLKVHVVP